MAKELDRLEEIARSIQPGQDTLAQEAYSIFDGLSEEDQRDASWQMEMIGLALTSGDKTDVKSVDTTTPSANPVQDIRVLVLSPIKNSAAAESRLGGVLSHLPHTLAEQPESPLQGLRQVSIFQGPEGSTVAIDPNVTGGLRVNIDYLEDKSISDQYMLLAFVQVLSRS